MLEYDFGFEEEVVVPNLGLLICFALIVIFDFTCLVSFLWNIVDLFPAFLFFFVLDADYGVDDVKRHLCCCDFGFNVGFGEPWGKMILFDMSMVI